MNILIVEDEKIAIRRLIKFLEELCPDCRVAGQADTIKSTVAWLRSNPSPDLAFFDIQLADGISFEVFKQVEISCPVVFITAYDEYALRAFEVNSIDYILKPVEKDKLERALTKYEKWVGTRGKLWMDDMVVDKVMESLKKKKFKERFIVKFGDHLKSVDTKEISCFYSEGKATFFLTRDRKKFLVDYTLDQVTSLLDPTQYFRINRKFIVSVHSIKDIVSWSNSRLKLTLTDLDHPELIVAREKVQDFRQWLDQ